MNSFLKNCITSKEFRDKESIRDNKILVLDFEGTMVEARFAEKYIKSIDTAIPLVESLSRNVYAGLKPLKCMQELVELAFEYEWDIKVVTRINTGIDVLQIQQYLRENYPLIKETNLIGVVKEEQISQTLRFLKKEAFMIYVDDNLERCIFLEEALGRTDFFSFHVSSVYE